MPPAPSLTPITYRPNFCPERIGFIACQAAGCVGERRTRRTAADEGDYGRSEVEAAELCGRASAFEGNDQCVETVAPRGSRARVCRRVAAHGGTSALAFPDVPGHRNRGDRRSHRTPGVRRKWRAACESLDGQIDTEDSHDSDGINVAARVATTDWNAAR
jgi:hypothetical protein